MANDAPYAGIGRPRIADETVMVSFRLPTEQVIQYNNMAAALGVTRAFCIRATLQYDEDCGVAFDDWIAAKASAAVAALDATAKRNAQRRRARIKAVFDESVSLDDVYREESGMCHICRGEVVRSQASLDHVVPLALGGRHSRANIKLAHRRCNSVKGARL